MLIHRSILPARRRHRETPMATSESASLLQTAGPPQEAVVDGNRPHLIGVSGGDRLGTNHVAGRTATPCAIRGVIVGPGAASAGRRGYTHRSDAPDSAGSRRPSHCRADRKFVQRSSTVQRKSREVPSSRQFTTSRDGSSKTRNEAVVCVGLRCFVIAPTRDHLGLDVGAGDAGDASMSSSPPRPAELADDVAKTTSDAPRPVFPRQRIAAHTVE